MNTVLRVIVFICGLFLVLPGLCTVAFGGMFALNGFGGGDVYGLGYLSIPWLIVGGLLLWGGWLVIAAAIKSPPHPPAPGQRPPPPPPPRIE